MNDPDEDDNQEVSTDWSSYSVNIEYITKPENKMDMC